MTDEQREAHWSAIHDLAIMRIAVTCLRSVVANDLVPLELLHAASRVELLLEAEQRYWHGDENDPGERLHLIDDDGIALCQHAGPHEEEMREARKPDVTSCPACLQAYWDAEDTGNL